MSKPEKLPWSWQHVVLWSILIGCLAVPILCITTYFGWTVWSRWSAGQTIYFYGYVVESSDNPLDYLEEQRLAVVFLNGQEVARDVGIGGFAIQAPNPSGLRYYPERFWLAEGEIEHVTLPNGDVYAIKVLKGEPSSLPEEIRKRRLILREDGTVEPSMILVSSSGGAAGMPLTTTRLLLGLAAFTIAFGLSSYFLADIFPWRKETRFSKTLSLAGAFFLSALFASWLLTAEEANAVIGQISRGFLGVLTTVISILFTMMGVYLIWKKVKAYIKPG